MRLSRKPWVVYQGVLLASFGSSLEGMVGRWVAGVLLCGVMAWCVSRGVLSYLDNQPDGGDVAVYRAGARTLLSGSPLYGGDVLPATPEYARLPFTYPPFAALAFAPLVLLPVQLAWGLLGAVSVLAVVAVTWLVLRALPLRPGWLTPGRGGILLGLVLVASMPLRSTLGYGQINAVLMALVVLDVLLICGASGGRGRFGGVLIGLAGAVKLTPLIFVPHLLMTGRGRDAVRAGVVFVAAQGVLLSLAPRDTVRYFTHTVFDSGRIGPTQSSWNQSLLAAVARLGDGAPWAQPVAYVLAGMLAIAAFALVRRLHRRGLGPHAVTVTGFLALVISPVSWVHHWVWIVPLAAVLLTAAVNGSAASRWALVATVLVFAYRPLYARTPGESGEPALNPLTFVLSHSYLLFALAVGGWAWWATRTTDNLLRAQCLQPRR